MNKNAMIFAFELATAVYWGAWTIAAIVTREPARHFPRAAVSYVVAMIAAVILIWLITSI